MVDSLPKADPALREQPNAAGASTGKRETLRSTLNNKWVLRFIVYGGLAIAWQATAVAKGPFFAPTIQDTFLAIGTSFSEGYYWTVLDSLRQMIIGFLISLVIAIPIGALMGRSRVAEDLFAPYVNTLFVTSKESLLPLIIIAFGTDLGYRIAVVILFALFFPIMNTAAGVRYVEKNLVETATAFCTSRWHMFSRVYLPAAAPFVVSGIRLGLGMAFKGMVVAELWVLIGMGGLLSETGRLRQLDVYFSIVLAILALAVGSNVLLKVLERKLRPFSKYTEKAA